MAAPQYITRLREMNDEQRQQMFATANTPLRRLIVSEYLAREVYGDEAFEKMYGFKEGPVYKSFKTSALKVLHKRKDGIRRRIFFKKEN